MLKTGLNRPLMQEIPEQLGECEVQLSDLFIGSAADESDINSPLK